MKLISFSMAFGLLALAFVAQGEEFAEPFDHFDASDLATARAEADRLDAIALQLATIDEMKWYAGLPTLRHPAPPSLDYIYGYGPQLARPYRPAPYFDVFEPWPYVPGDIWGYQWYRPVRQPIGRIEVQTGPDRWESHPIYEPVKRKRSGPREF